MKTILDCPRCEEINNCTMRCLSVSELKTYLKSDLGVSRVERKNKSAAASALEALTSSEAVAPAPHHEEQSK